MITKKPVRGGKFVSVTFRAEAPKKARSLRVLGEFNDWDPKRHPMKRRKDGNWSTTIRLPQNRQYQFRYLADGKQWITDEAGDALAVNEFGGQNAVLRT